MAHDLAHLLGLGGQAAGVHAEVAGVRVGTGEREGAVRQAALLADLLEQARGHARTKRAGQHAQRVAAVVARDDARAAHHDVGLLKALLHLAQLAQRYDAAVGTHTARRGGHALPQVPAVAGERLQHEANHGAVLQGTGGGNHQAIRGVVALVVLPHGVTRDRLNLLGGAADGASEGVGAHELLHEVLEGDVGRVVLIHRDFFENHPAFLLQVGGIKQGVGHHIGDDVHGHGRVVVEHTRVVAGVFFGGQRIGFSAHRVEGGRNVERRAGTGAFEQQVLQKVRGAEHAGSLVTRAHPHPEADGHAARAGHLLGDDAHATGQDGAAHLVAARALVDEAATLVVELLGNGVKLDGQGNRHSVSFDVSSVS